MGTSAVGEVFKYIINSLLYQQSGNEILDVTIYWTSFFAEIIAAIGVLLIILLNEPVRKRLRTQDRLIFWQCVMVFVLNVLQVSLVPMVYSGIEVSDPIFLVALLINEVLYMSVILQWLICVDYSLFYSEDHIRRQYRKAAIPILIVAVFETMHSLVYYFNQNDELPIIGKWADMGMDALYVFKLIVEISYILQAVYMVRKYEKIKKEPSFLRLDAFIIPFVFGVLFRFYDASFAGYGVILTYIAMKRRDRYINFKTGLYNDKYLDYLCSYWDKKEYHGASALLMHAEENSRQFVEILSDIKIQDTFIINMSQDKFLLITGAVKNSALKMAELMISEQAADADEPFAPKMISLKRSSTQSMTEFGDRIKEIFREKLS